MKRTPGALVSLALVLLFAALPVQARPSGAFATGRDRNLFREGGHSKQEISHKIAAAFQPLFHGDPATQTVYYAAGDNANGPLAYLTDINHRDVRSEGMSYGMMIAVQLNKKVEFDALWNWSKTYMYHDCASHPAYGFFSWSMKTDGTPNSESPAPDGEENWTMALYFAAGRWGNGQGIYNYRAAADRLLDNMKNRVVITGPTIRGEETGGPEFNLEHKMVRFTPNNRRSDHTDPSYHLPAFYELWARWGPVADRSFWSEAAESVEISFRRSPIPRPVWRPTMQTSTALRSPLLAAALISRRTPGEQRPTGQWTGPGGRPTQGSGS